MVASSQRTANGVFFAGHQAVLCGALTRHHLGIQLSQNCCLLILPVDVDECVWLGSRCKSEEGISHAQVWL